MLNLGHVFEALNIYREDAAQPEISGVVVDSRKAAAGALFVALPGEHLDGHDFVEDAFRRGAVAAIVERPVPGDHAVVEARASMSTGGPRKTALPVCIRVEHTLLALQRIAAFWRARSSPRVIGITGSIGKTTTKELVYTVLRTRFHTLKSEGNYNNEIGLPLTLLQLDETYQRVVLEMGMYATGEISTLADIARPQVGVITNVGPVHMERLGSIQAIANAKAELVEALPPGPKGIAILNQDEPLVRAMAGSTQAQVFTYGLSPNSDLWADEIESLGLEGIRFTLHYRGEAVHIRAPLLGRHSVHTALRAASVGLVEGLDWSHIVNGLQSDSLQLRLVAVNGPNNSLILDDTYNASPASTIAALNLLADLDNRRVAVLGDMLELGAYEEVGHRIIGRRVAGVADLLVTVGALGRIIAEEALVAGMSPGQVLMLPDVETAKEVLPGLIQEHDMVLIKGSRGARLEDLVDYLTFICASQGGDSGREAA